MSRKIAKPEVAAVIKWTEEEWNAIAERLLEVYGSPLLSSGTLEEIKAKDVFNAQDVLAPNRHRKLISISQGFSASRQRLHSLIQVRKRGFNKGRESLKAKGKQQSEQVTLTTVDSGRRRKSETGPEAPESPLGKGATSRPNQRTGVADKPGLFADEQRLGVVSTAVTEPSTSDRPTPSSGAELPEVRNHDDELRRVMREAKRQLSGAQATADQKTNISDGAGGGDSRRPAPSSSGYQQRQSGQSGDRVPAHAAAEMHTAPAAVQPSVDLVELARPFVAMVCQEFASALVGALSRNGGEKNLTGAVQAMFSGMLERQLATRDAEALALHHVGPKSHQHGNMVDDDKDHGGEADVQPLFDPKLPPSPNSAFKPKIGLIGADRRDFHDLQQFYPQLQLTVVSPDAVQNAPDLGECQRMLGLREDISADTDEYLRRAFGNRYLRMAGGAERVREQLDAWLDNPGSINSSGRPRKQFKGKGGGMSKKRHNRHPGAAR